MIMNRDKKLDKKTLAMRGLVDQCVTGNHTKEKVWNPLLELMASLSLEGFPLTPPVRKDLPVWKMAAKLLRKTGVAAFFSVTVSSHPYNSKDIASLGLPKALSSIEGIDIRDAIQMYSSATFASLKALKKDFIPPVHRLNVVRFATELERLYQLYSGDRSFQISKLAYISPANEFLREVFDGVPHSVFSQDSEVYIQSPYFFSNVVGLVQKTAPHTVMNFLGVRTMIQMSPFLPQSDLLDVYSSILYSAPRTSVPRWKLCLRTVEKAIPSLFLRSSLADIDLHGSAARFTELRQEDFLQLMMDAQDGVLEAAAESTLSANEKLFNLDSEIKVDTSFVGGVKALTEEEAMAQCVLFFAAGQDTTSSVLAFTLYLLAIHPEVQAKLREQADECFKQHGPDPSLDVVSKLKYLHGVVSESLRMFPPGPRLERSSPTDYVLGDTGIKIPKDCPIAVPVYAMHHDPEYFPDPSKFDPDRFSEENIDNIRPYTYLPFGAGPRNCIGMRFALETVKLSLLHSVHSVEFVRTNNTKVPLEFATGFSVFNAKNITIGVRKRTV
ncbi:putative ece1 protein [Ixodes scapularis]